MNCYGCGAHIHQAKCSYCGLVNQPSADHQLGDFVSENLERIENIKSRIARLKDMPMPESMKQQKIALLEKELYKYISA